ncbi:uncharacterized protein LY89DRAFT_731124 [Mollisia scopiformis]|uniref:Uncharacterized protein n=1 Tax=Mollisia scopiformis TaxID=149040 RepID=A0A194XIB7_MOLSC|nr:uncharacterized protein LY89DRAFT_731124 [Mollisia scopiformis]KUJ19876.1 hypothetical protein LY89DRAFT_731124 [Mollisia scopiformis]
MIEPHSRKRKPQVQEVLRDTPQGSGGFDESLKIPTYGPVQDISVLQDPGSGITTERTSFAYQGEAFKQPIRGPENGNLANGTDGLGKAPPKLSGAIEVLKDEHASNEFESSKLIEPTEQISSQDLEYRSDRTENNNHTLVEEKKLFFDLLSKVDKALREHQEPDKSDAIKFLQLFLSRDFSSWFREVECDPKQAKAVGFFLDCIANIINVSANIGKSEIAQPVESTSSKDFKLGDARVENSDLQRVEAKELLSDQLPNIGNTLTNVDKAEAAKAATITSEDVHPGEVGAKSNNPEQLEAKRLSFSQVLNTENVEQGVARDELVGSECSSAPVSETNSATSEIQSSEQAVPVSALGSESALSDDTLRQDLSTENKDLQEEDPKLQLSDEIGEAMTSSIDAERNLRKLCEGTSKLMRASSEPLVLGGSFSHEQEAPSSVNIPAIGVSKEENMDLGESLVLNILDDLDPVPRAKSIPIFTEEDELHILVEYRNNGREAHGVPLKDTGSFTSWVSLEFLGRLGHADSILPPSTGDRYATLNGTDMLCKGTVTLNWRELDQNKHCEDVFRVAELARHDIVFGYDILKKYNYVTWNFGRDVKPACAIFPAKKESPEQRQMREEAQRQQAERVQKEEEQKRRDELEKQNERRRKLQSGSSSGAAARSSGN